MRRSASTVRFIALVLVTAILTAVTACTQSAAPATTPATTTAPTTKPSAATSAKPVAPTGDPIKFGWTYDLTVNPDAGLGGKAGYDAAVDDINAAGGIMGRPVQVISYDDQGDVTKAQDNVKKLLYVDKADVILQLNPSSTLGTATLLTQEKKVNFQAYMVYASIYEDPAKYPYHFTTGTTSLNESREIAKYIVKTLGKTKVAMLVDNTAYGKMESDELTAALKELGVPQPLDIQQFALTDLDLTTQLKLEQSKGAEVLFFGQRGPIFNTFINNLNTMGWNIPVVGNMQFSYADWDKLQALPVAKNFAMLSSRFAVADSSGNVSQKTLDFVKKWKSKLPKPVTGNLTVPMLAYDSLWLLKAAIEKTGSTSGPELTKTLESMSEFRGPLIGESYPFRLSAKQHDATPLEGLTMVKVFPTYHDYFKLEASR